MSSNRPSLLLGILAVVAAITTAGALSFYYFEKPGSPSLTIYDSFWWAMVTVTTIGYGDIFPKTGGGRLVAIFLMFAGIGTLGVSTAAIAAYFVQNDQLQLLRLRRMSGHVVICGLGEKGLLLAKSFSESGRDVVVIEQSEGNEFVSVCREQGSVVLIGNAREPETLKRARVGAAKYLIAVCGDDGANAEVAAHARDLVGARAEGDRAQGVLTCSTHIVDPELWYLLRKWELAQSGSFRLQFFNVFDIGARALLEAHPPFARASPHASPQVLGGEQAEPPPHLLIIGGGRLGQSLVVHAARAWRDLHAADDDAGEGEGEGDEELKLAQRLRVTLIDRETATIKEFLHLRHPELERVCRIDTHAVDVSSPTFHRASFLFDAEGRCDVSMAYVCLSDDAVSLSAALALHHRIGIAGTSKGIPIVVRMTQEAGLATLLHGLNSSGGQFGTLHAVGLLERICQPDLVLGGTNEMLARALHQKYLDDQAAAGHTANGNHALVPWPDLPEEVKESNRSQARSITQKLKAIGCDIVPLADWNAARFPFSPEEVEMMARMEHERWCDERRSQGWTHGPRDNARKTNPSLLPWPRLPEQTRGFNRQAVSEIPASLAQAGFQIYRLQSA